MWVSEEARGWTANLHARVCARREGYSSVVNHYCGRAADFTDVADRWEMSWVWLRVANFVTMWRSVVQILVRRNETASLYMRMATTAERSFLDILYDDGGK